jgi:hypothetical protein
VSVEAALGFAGDVEEVFFESSFFAGAAPDELGETDGSASATAGIVTMALPTPSATANAPTRPTYLT